METARQTTSRREPRQKKAKAAVSPMMQQYLIVKEQVGDAILFFRVGDFYEMFLEDAVTAARELEIALTSRDKGSENPVPLCGVPHHAANGYIQRLVNKGFKVAICDQVEDAKQAKGLVRREVVQIVTPGLVLDEESLEARAPSYLLALAPGKDAYGISYLDISTGEFLATQVASPQEVAQELQRITPKEILVAESAPLDSLLKASLGSSPAPMISQRPASEFEVRKGRTLLEDHLGVVALDGQGLGSWNLAIAAAGAVLAYAQENAKAVLSHVNRIAPYYRNDVLVLDEATRKNLEIFESAQGGRKGSLLSIMDETISPMGGRALRNWVASPQRSLSAITERLDAVESLRDDRLRREEIRTLLKGVSDLERIVARASTGRASPRDLGALGQSLTQLPSLIETLDTSSGLLSQIQKQMDPCTELAEQLQCALVDDPPLKVTSGSFIREGYDSELDEVISLSRDGKSWIVALEKKERERTGIGSLKVRYNRVFGYYIEVTKTHLAKIPQDYQRKQTTATAERYFTPELKELEDKVLGAEDRRSQLELELFESLRKLVSNEALRVQGTSQAVATLDALTGLAEIADRYDYCRPEIHDGFELELEDGRHPVIERLNLGEPFVPNDVVLEPENRLLIITGPNMAGKSTVMRQTALIVLMAQTGSFVPCKTAKIGIVDRIFTRVGASDLLAKGQSTFMVEMSETANILNNATDRSLIIVDEIGRGTSTFDGVSIAWAVAEDLHDRVGAKTLFATHYHELTDLQTTKEHVRNMSIAVKEWNQKIIFLRKLVQGSTSRSYGIQVARLAGLPDEVLDRAQQVLSNLEAGELDALGVPKLAQEKSTEGKVRVGQLNLFTAPEQVVCAEVAKLDLDTMTPLAALEFLASLQERLQNP